MEEYGWKAAIGAAVRLLEADQRAHQACWLVGGSCGLAMQGIRLASAPKDLDLYADVEDMARLHRSLAGCSLEAPVEDFSRGCYSVISRYRFAGFPAELVGGFEIRAEGSRYRTEAGILRAWAPQARLAGGGELRLMPLAHELIFNVLRGRHDRAEAIADAMRASPVTHLRQLGALIARNSLTVPHIEMLARLLGGSWPAYRRSMAT